MIAVPTTVLVAVDGADVVVVVVEVVAGVEVVGVEAGGAAVVVVVRAGALVVVVVEVLVVPLPAPGDPLLVEALGARVVVVAPRELSDNVAGLLWKLINAAKPATVATATNPARLTVEFLSLYAFVFDSSRH